MTIHAARDAIDIMGCRHVLITAMDISGGGDDAVKFGSDFSRGKVHADLGLVPTIIEKGVGGNGAVGGPHRSA